MKILVRHGITPTGVGIRQNDNGSLRPLSPCCGALMEGTKAYRLACSLCGKDLTELLDSVAPKTLGNDVRVLPGFDGDHATIREWLKVILGDPTVKVEIT